MSLARKAGLPSVLVLKPLPAGMANGAFRAALTFTSIQAAIDAAAPGSVVLVPAGIYNEQLTIVKPITLSGPDPGQGEAIINAAGLPTRPTVWIQASQVTVRQFTIEDGPGQAVVVGSNDHLNLTAVTIEDNKISGHGRAGILTLFSAAIKIQRNELSGNATAIGFGRAGVYLSPHGPCQVSNNVIHNNALDGIYASGSDSGLVIEGNDIQHHSNSGITLAWDERQVSIKGNTISACGSGNADEQGGIVIIQSCAELIENNIIENCNRYGLIWGWVPTTGPIPAEILIQGNIIRTCARDAIYLFSQGPGGFISPDLYPLEPQVSGNSLLGNTRAGIYVSNLYYYSPGNANPTIVDNKFIDNGWGVYNATAQTVTAINNWWGAASGPFNPTLNPAGAGDPVSDRVDFIPWQTLPQPVGVDCVEVVRVLGWCVGDSCFTEQINLPARFKKPGPGLKPAAVAGQIKEHQCTVVSVDANELEGRLDITVRVELVINFWLKDAEGGLLYQFEHEVERLLNLALAVPDLKSASCPQGWSISAGLMKDSCQPRLFASGGPPILLSIISLCFSLQATTPARICLPVYSVDDLWAGEKSPFTPLAHTIK